jgi:ABC-2 type transport system permease protein
MSGARSSLAAIPTILRVSAAETLAYRTEFAVWMLTTTLPLIMLGLWTSVAHEAPFASFGQREFIAYYLGALIIRNLTGSWIVWQLNDDVRRGSLNMKLLRPIHPFVFYAFHHLASVPLRAAIALPFAAILLITSARDLLITDPARIAILVLAVAGAWVLTFFILVAIGSLALFMDKSVALFDVYLGVFAVLSGYLVPLELLPGWAQSLADVTPFRYMLAFPVELLMGRLDAAEAATQLGIQWLFVAGAIAAALTVWRLGIRRYEAFGT